MLVKAAVSPNSPVTAYFAVFIQGVFGEVFFYNKRYFKTSAIIFATFVLMITAIQRIITLTILFGNNLWHSINIYTGYILNKFNLTESNINVSYIIIGVYIFMHMLIGFLAGKFASGMPDKIKNTSIPEDFNLTDFKAYKSCNDQYPKKKKSGRKALSKIFFVIILLLVILSYLNPGFGKKHSLDLLIMLIRSVIIIFLWITLVSPFLYKSLQKYLDKKEAPFINRINKIISSFPDYRRILDYSISKYRNEKIVVGVKKSFILFISLALFTELEK